MRKRELPSLGGQAWLQDEALQKVLRVLNEKGETRIAGGAVRNALLGVPVSDVDLATRLRPDAVMQVAGLAGFGLHPTGLDHGTVTVTHGGAAFEVTTLRRDVETDGRHAVVRFTEDWAEDAARRDFTMNALYCDATGKIFDYTEGYADIQKRKVKFVGNASARIREDYLRILRFFRFHAWYGRGRMDAAGLRACGRLKAGLRNLSAERVRQEMLKLLAAPRAIETVKQMADKGVLKTVLPHTDDWRALKRLPSDPLLRLFVLAREPSDLKDRLRLSNAEARHIQWLVRAPHVSPAMTPAEQRRMLYHVGHESWQDVVALSKARASGSAGWDDLIMLAELWPVPHFPIKGEDLAAAGIAPGPRLGQILAALEDWWVASDFAPSRDDLMGRIGRYKG